MSTRDAAKLFLLLAGLMATGACAPGRAIVRGNWPDGRLEAPARGRTMAVATRPAPQPQPVAEEWAAAAAEPSMTAADYNRMDVLQTVYFDFDSHAIRDDQIARVQMNAAWLLDHPDVQIIVEGHCDERGTREYNMALGQQRADATRDFLIALGVEPQRIETVSFGEELPAVAGHDEAAWSANRRTVMIITATGVR